MREVEELERQLYGETSTQLGKTFKVIGTIHLLNKNHIDAKEYLIKAQNIFEQKGLLKLLKEVKQKLKLLNPNKFNQLISDGGLNAAQMLGVGGGVDSEDEIGDVATPEQIMGKRPNKMAAKKKKKMPTGTKKFNNYINER